LDALRPLSPAATVVVIGPQMDAVARFVAPAESVVQDPPLGTGHAVQAALGRLDGHFPQQGDIDEVLVLYGDTRFLATETLARLLADCGSQDADLRPEDLSFERGHGRGETFTGWWSAADRTIASKAATPCNISSAVIG
jgi:bifunctional N-acetylglucosamine-1-phosphate-uridyltransferase/glucosamine-1-phosphate-acetyltransferase GlmU-like protein